MCRGAKRRLGVCVGGGLQQATFSQSCASGLVIEGLPVIRVQTQSKYQLLSEATPVSLPSSFSTGWDRTVSYWSRRMCSSSRRWSMHERYIFCFQYSCDVCAGTFGRRQIGLALHDPHTGISRRPCNLRAASVRIFPDQSLNNSYKSRTIIVYHVTTYAVARSHIRCLNNRT